MLPTPNTTDLREAARCGHFTQARARSRKAVKAAAFSGDELVISVWGLGSGVWGFGAQRVPDFFTVNDVVGLLPKLDFSEFTIEPAVADDAVFGWWFTGEIVRLRGAGHCRKRRRDVRQRATVTEFRDARRVFTDERFGEADDVDDGQAVHAVARTVF